jgi:hypothetical protein
MHAFHMRRRIPGLRPLVNGTLSLDVKAGAVGFQPLFLPPQLSQLSLSARESLLAHCQLSPVLHCTLPLRLCVCHIRRRRIHVGGGYMSPVLHCTLPLRLCVCHIRRRRIHVGGGYMSPVVHCTLPLRLYCLSSFSILYCLLSFVILCRFSSFIILSIQGKIDNIIHQYPSYLQLRMARLQPLDLFVSLHTHALHPGLGVGELLLRRS